MEELPVQYRVFKALKLWTLYVDLEESVGTFQVQIMSLLRHIVSYYCTVDQGCV